MAGTSGASLRALEARMLADAQEVMGLFGLNILIDFEALERLRNPPPTWWERVRGWFK